jgi:hypothetical protein
MAGYALSHGDAGDIRVLLEALDDPENQRNSRIITTAIHGLVESAPASMRPLAEYFANAPTSKGGRVAATALGEIAEESEGVPDSSVIPALVAGLKKALQKGTGVPREPVATLAVLSETQQVPEAGPVMAELLAQAAREEDPYELKVRDALAVLARNDQMHLLDPLRESFAALEPSHPVRRLLADGDVE